MRGQNKHTVSLLTVVLTSLILVGLTVFLCMLDPEFEPNAFILSSVVLLCVWAFFFAPAMRYAIAWVVGYFNNLNFEQGFRIGYLLGTGLGIIAVLLFLLASPVVGILWYIRTGKEIAAMRRVKKEAVDESDEIFEI